MREDERYPRYEFAVMSMDELNRVIDELVGIRNRTRAGRRPFTGIETECSLADAWWRYRKAQGEAEKALHDISRLIVLRAPGEGAADSA